MLKVIKTSGNGWDIEFDPEFELLKPIQKLDLIQDCLYELNKKFKHVNETF